MSTDGSSLAVDHCLDELVEHELCIHRTRTGFWVELTGEPWLRLVANALVAAVVHVDEEFFPFLAKG